MWMGAGVGNVAHLRERVGKNLQSCVNGVLSLRVSSALCCALRRFAVPVAVFVGADERSMQTAGKT